MWNILYGRMSFDSCLYFFQTIVPSVFEKPIRERKLEGSLLSSPSILEYTNATLSLCWRMVLQQPPMTLDCTSLLGERFPEDRAEPHFGSADPTSKCSVVQYYVYPSVMHGRTLMKKARVFLVLDRPLPHALSSPRRTEPARVNERFWTNRDFKARENERFKVQRF